MLRATTACTFSTSQLPKVVRTWCVLYILTWKCASRHNGVQFFISHLASWLRTRRFSEPTFRPSGAPNHWKNTVFRDFPTFSRICIFFLLTLSLLLFFLLIFLFSLPLPCSAFHLSCFFPHIQGFKSNQGSHVILVALICSINIEPFRKNRESKKLNLAPGLRVTSNSATLKFTREEPPSGLLTLRMPEPTVDPTNY